MADQPMPSVGATVAHKEDHAKSKGPVWEVTKVTPAEAKPIEIKHVKGHKLNAGLDSATKKLTQGEYQSDYVPL